MQHYNNSFTPNPGRDPPVICYQVVAPTIGVRVHGPPSMGGHMVLSNVPQSVPPPYHNYDSEFPPSNLGGESEQCPQNSGVRPSFGSVLNQTSLHPSPSMSHKEFPSWPQSMTSSPDLLRKSADRAYPSTALNDLCLDWKDTAQRSLPVRSTPPSSMFPLSQTCNMEAPKSPPDHSNFSAVGQDKMLPPAGSVQVRGHIKLILFLSLYIQL